MNSTTRKITQVDKVKKYLIDIGITEPLRKRIEEVHSHIQKILPSKVLDVVILDHIKRDGTHVYDEIDLQTEEYGITAMDFTTGININVGSAKKRIVFMRFVAENFDFKKANPDSRLYVELGYDLYDLVGNFHATGRNCDYVWEYIRKYFLPRLRD